MIDLDKLQYYTAARDREGRPVLLPKAKPVEFGSADPVSRRAYEHAAQREHGTVGAAARHAAMVLAPKPAGWDQASAITKRAWHLEVERALVEGKL